MTVALSFAYGFVCVLQGELEEGLKVYKDLIDENPTDFRPYLCQASYLQVFLCDTLTLLRIWKK